MSKVVKVWVMYNEKYHLLWYKGCIYVSCMEAYIMLLEYYGDVLRS